MKTVIFQPSAAYLIREPRAERQALLQRDPFAVRNNRAHSDATIALLRLGPEVRTAARPVVVECLDPSDEPRMFIEQFRSLFLKTLPEVDQATRERIIFDFGWKIGCVHGLVPRRVLSIGCGEAGHELIGLRAAFPNAAIKALDWGSGPPKRLLDAVNVSFVRMDANNGLSEKFDVIFSNHTIEHFYDPDEMFSQMRELLSEKGILVSALPLDGDPESAFRGRLERWARRPAAVSLLDVGWLDAGHPWKTNVTDLVATLERARFIGIRVIRRDHALVRGNHYDGAALLRRRRVGRRFNAVMFTVLKTPLSLIRECNIARHILFALENRMCWFGDSRLKNDTAAEVTFIALRDQAAGAGGYLNRDMWP